jgi:2-keto-4-pentenoate hydratase/2-oxohepta-3-ene-1,7-dioic acid hydratase in catechol pathway
VMSEMRESTLRFAVFDGYRVGLVDESVIHDVTDCFDGWEASPPGINRVIGEWPNVLDRIAEAISTPNHGLAIADKVLLSPVPSPTHLFGAPVNYRSHQGEVKVPGPDAHGSDASSRGFFVLTPSSVVGPGGSIELPDLPGEREFDYEGEVAVVIGKAGRSIPPDRAWEHIFGITGFIDVTLRQDETHHEERSMRKSYATFNPIGPYIRITNGALDPGTIFLELSLNGELRQRASLEDLIVGIPELISSASTMIPLQPGDVFATGTPSGVGRLAVGDRISLMVTGVGTLDLDVTQRQW